jgi:Abnormal spindle-like microcephaly-assoc'd, ASPM-SPD-2-Hydin/OmpA-like transmembrane domain
MKIDFGSPLLKAFLSCLLVMGFAAPASAQFKLEQDFKGTTAPGWTLSSSAILTAPSIDTAGSGWLRLTDTGGNEKGHALNDGFSFAGNVPVVVEFNYVSWGGTGADGMALFLFDASTASPMAGAQTGGGLGYCGGAGGYLAIGLDEYGNFSNPGDKCLAASGGPGAKADSLVIRGPMSANNAWVSTTSIPGGIDNPLATSRPSPKTVILTLTPAVTPSVGYTITAQLRSAAGQPFQTLFSNVPFPYVPPANISVGLSGSTGGSTNFHELQGLGAATPDDLQVTMTGPSSVLQGASVTYNVTVTNNGNNTLSGGDSPTFLDNVPASITGAAWTCSGTGGATCGAAAGTGNINTADVTLPANASVTYTITGTLDPAATCGATVANTANADFSSTTRFLDPDETNNTASVNSTVTCNTTLVANPASLTYSPQQLSVASSSQSVLVTEGSNSAAITSIAATGDYSQTNNCPASLTAGQTCTINVTFTPTAEGSRNGTLTILSNAAASPTVTSTVTLTGTGINSIPSAFSFTPLINVDPSSVQVSNSISVANTDVPSPISVSAGAQYSINGGAFTSVAGVVSPGAQVQVQLTAASGYGTSDSAVLTIGGVSSTFMVTTGAQPVLQGSFAPVTGAVPSSVQTSNAITVTGTIPVPISVTGGTYSINGGAFTSTAGAVQPGDQVVVQMSAASTYNTSSSTILNIGGVTSPFTVTTAAQPPQQAGFTPVTGSSIGVTQISNPITVTNITAAAPISVSSGAQYSINGGPFTGAPGTVQPGDQVTVEINAPSSYSSTSTAVLTIGGSTSNFAVTTAAEPVLQGTFTNAAGAAVSSTQVSNPITVTGITTPAVISITGGSYSINGGAFTSVAGTVHPGDQVTVQITAPSTFNTTATAVLTIDGVNATFAVTTGGQALNVAVTGGGGAIGMLTLAMLMLLVAFKTMGQRRAAQALPMLFVSLVTLWSSPARAEDGNWLSNLYTGVRVGDSTSSMTASKLTRDLQADGYQVTASGAERGTASGSLYVGYELRDHFAVEVAGTYVGRTRAALEGVLPANLNPLLNDAARIVRGSGDIISLEGRYRWPLVHAIDLDLRAGPYVWITRTDVYVNGADQLSRTDDGIGYTLGLGPRFALGQHFAVGVGADFLQSNSDNHFVVFSATLEYHFR